MAGHTIEAFTGNVNIAGVHHPFAPTIQLVDAGRPTISQRIVQRMVEFGGGVRLGPARGIRFTWLGKAQKLLATHSFRMVEFSVARIPLIVDHPHGESLARNDSAGHSACPH
jgi:hypothetical protein